MLHTTNLTLFKPILDSRGNTTEIKREEQSGNMNHKDVSNQMPLGMLIKFYESNQPL